MNICKRLSELLAEREIDHAAVEGDGWYIYFRLTNDDSKPWEYLINKDTKIEQLFWLDEGFNSDDDKWQNPTRLSLAIGFENWLIDLNGIFHAHFGCTSSDFEDYNWFDEYENEVSPEDAFEEWKCLNDAGTLGG